MSETRWHDVGVGSWVGTDPSDRFPTYTRGNAGEVYPEVFRPLSFSLSAAWGEQAMRNSMRRSGLFTDDELSAPITTGLANGVFGGYAYLNLSAARLMAERLPGSSAADVDDTYLGLVDDRPPAVPSETARNVRASLRGLRYVLRTIRTTELPQLAIDQRRVEQFLTTLPALDAPDAELATLVDEHQVFFAELFETHLVISGQAGLCVGALGVMCERNLGRPELLGDLLAGLGDVDSAAPSLDLWDLGRAVAADPGLTAAFDAGIDGLTDRLRDGGFDDFEARFSAFLATHGCRGPNEWDTAFDTWETEPRLALALIDRLRLADADHDPRAQAARLAATRAEAEAAAREALNGLNRRIFDRVLAAAQMFSRSRERSKTTVIRAIHGLRLRAKELDRRLVARSGGAVGDLWFVVADELADYVADPAGFRSTIEERRATHVYLSEREPPFTFTGHQPPPSTWPLRSRGAAALAVGDQLQGIPGCPGVARGRARVVLDAGDPRDLEPGDVLVAPHTDPAWTPLFLSANAVVVDVGAVLSHAVIVSRELGIPCVVSATDATRRIPDGAIIEVDGGAGTVTVVPESAS